MQTTRAIQIKFRVKKNSAMWKSKAETTALFTEDRTLFKQDMLVRIYIDSKNIEIQYNYKEYNAN